MEREENLIPQSHLLSNEERSKGGKKSGETRRLKRAVKRALQGKVPGTMTELIEVLNDAGIDTTNDNGIAFAIVLKALKGDLSAANWIRDMIGEKPKEEMHLGADSVVIISGDDKLEN